MWGIEQNWKEVWQRGFAIEEAIGFCIEYLVDFTAIRHRVWNDKKDPSMFDEVLEGGGHP
jgi:hypothetical protein